MGDSRVPDIAHQAGPEATGSPARSIEGQEHMEPPPEITFEEIRERAYDLWERNHRPDGFEIEFWLMAERELKAELSRSQVPKSADKSRTQSADPEAQGQEPGSA